jgi:hypothetical protein
LSLKGQTIFAIGVYTGAAVFYNGNQDVLSKLNDNADAGAAIVAAVSGVTGTAHVVDLTPYTTVDKQVFDFDVANFHDSEEEG